MMRSYSCSSGGVIFVPDEIEYKTKSVSYRDLAPEETSAQEQPGPLATAKDKPQADEGIGNVA